MSNQGAISPPVWRIATADTPEQLAVARTLFVEYAESLGFSLCFQGFDEELATLPGRYAPPRGRLYLAWQDGRAVGCAAFRPLDEVMCEMKRLYVRPAARGLGLGGALAGRVVAGARAAGYRRMRLDTLASMTAAEYLYGRLGFRPTAPYYHNPHPGVRYFELDLEAVCPTP